MLSRCFHFGVLENFVSSLFLPPIFLKKLCCVSDTYVNLTDSQEEDHDGRGSLHLPDCSCQCPASLLRYHWINVMNDGTGNGIIHGLPDVQGASASFGVHGFAGSLHNLGGYHCSRWHPWIYACLCVNWFHYRSGFRRHLYQLRCGSYHDEAASRPSFQEDRQRYLHLCYFDEVMTCQENLEMRAVGICRLPSF